MSSKSPVNVFVWNHASIFWETCIKLTFSGCPRKFYHRVMYRAPSSGHISLNFNMPFKLILRRFWGCFLMSGVRMLHFLKDWWKFIQIHQYYTMALTMFSLVKLCATILKVINSYDTILVPLTHEIWVWKHDLTI